MADVVKALRPLLIREEIKFLVDNDSLFIALPNDFGELEITNLDDDDDIIGIVR